MECNQFFIAGITYIKIQENYIAMTKPSFSVWFIKESWSWNRIWDTQTWKEAYQMADLKAEGYGGAGYGNYGFIIFLIFILLIFGVGFFGGYI